MNILLSLSENDKRLIFALLLVFILVFVLIGYIGAANTQKKEDSFITANLIPAVDSSAVSEVLIMPALNLPLGEKKK